MVRKTWIFIGVIIIYFAGIISGWYFVNMMRPPIQSTPEAYIPPRYVDIEISLEANSFKQSTEHVGIKVSMLNLGNKIIYGGDYCYNFILTFPNGTMVECYLAANASSAPILPLERYESNMSLWSYSYDYKTHKPMWQQRPLPVGIYRIYSIYKSRTAESTMWWSTEDMGRLPYAETSSREVKFEIVE